ncbi:hypothetical protein TWF481_000063 [Arthrobotrys musiformis]|uniref:Peptidase S8/S53 domain-containing protein n=1 Tax=Arthrobotrys musiformis TaxID=47236 RepID=A0AAV9WS74_9PEZI
MHKAFLKAGDVTLGILELTIKKRVPSTSKIPTGTLRRSTPDWGLRMISRPPGQSDTGKYYYRSTEGRGNHTFVLDYFRVEHWGNAFQRILDDMEVKIRKSKERGEALPPEFIVTTTFSFGWWTLDTWPWSRSKFNDTLKIYREFERTFLQFAGREDALLNDLPPLFWPHDIILKRKDSFQNVVFVSGVDAEGRNAVPELKLPAIFAPSEDIKAAQIKTITDWGYKSILGFRDAGVGTFSGNSLAAPVVSGILANFMADGKMSTRKAKELRESLAYPRGPNHDISINPPVVWNGQMNPANGPESPFPIRISYVCNDKGRNKENQGPAERDSVLIPVARPPAPDIEVVETVSLTITRCEAASRSMPTPANTIKPIVPTLVSYPATPVLGMKTETCACL